MSRPRAAALAGRPYAALTNRVFVSLQTRTDAKLHPLLQVREVKKELVIMISSEGAIVRIVINSRICSDIATSCGFLEESTPRVIFGMVRFWALA